MTCRRPLTLGADRVAPRRPRSSATPDILIQPGRLAGACRAGPDRLSRQRRVSAQLAGTRARRGDPGAPMRETLTALPRIVCDNPYAYFARVSQLFNPAVTQPARRACRRRSLGARACRLRRARLDRRRLRASARASSIGDDSCLYPRRRGLPRLPHRRARDRAFRRGDRRRRLRHRARRRALGQDPADRPRA